MDRSVRRAASAAAVLGWCALTACLTRPVAKTQPITKTNFTTTIPNTAVDKIDLLFDIDNSASMRDKQDYLVRAIPDLVDRLLNPNCVDAGGATTVRSDNGVCPAGQSPEFRPVHDMHLGVVTSSLGSRLSDKIPGGLLCDPGIPGNDDQAHLLARGQPPEDAMGAPVRPVPDAVVPGYAPAPGGFLYWYPSSTPSPSPSAPAGLSAVTDPATLVADFGSMVSGAGAAGCGIESQLESWYRFLVQPEPYASLALQSVGGTPVATWEGVDTMILRERRDFLRPDSLVAIIVLTDENDSEVDVRSAPGTGYKFMARTYKPYRGTSACSADPARPDCMPCDANPTDPACAVPAGSTTGAVYSAANDWGYDANLRHVHMKAKYGRDVQYPIQRYAIGLTSPTVPDRNGEYPPDAGSYALGNNNCTNPLFAASLPDGSDTTEAALCNLPLGTRTTDLVYYAVIGGVPHELLHFVDGDPNASALTDDDWVRIVGRGPAAITMSSAPSYDYSNIDPHMIEDYRDRTVSYPFPVDSSKTGPLVPADAATGTSFNGREWVTDQQHSDAGAGAGGHVQPVDLQYACTFPLPTPRDCSQQVNLGACDCPATATGLSHAQVPSVCDDQNPTLQISAKAYPTIRELLVARLMGDRGIVSSLCPIHPADQGTTDHPDPLYGYRPAVTAIIDRLKVGLSSSCIPQRLTPDPVSGAVPCLVLVTLPESNGGSCDDPVCDPTHGLTKPPDDVLGRFCASVADPTKHSVCQLRQLTPEVEPSDFVAGSCSTDQTDPGWCYVTGVGHCAQSVIFSPTALPSGSLTSLQCIEQGATGTTAQLPPAAADGG
jgi:hypothetical protein